MKAFFQDIYTYHHHFNQRIAEQLLIHEKTISERTVPLFFHVINAHQIWNARILNERELGVFEIHNLRRCKSLDEENFNQTLNILATRNLDDVVTYTNSRGQKHRSLVRDILFHICNHSSHHKGQIIADFRQSGIAPLVTDYIYYKR